jgi:hypothetical protein
VIKTLGSFPPFHSRQASARLIFCARRNIQVSSIVRLGWTLAILGLYLLHQDIWWWRDARPLIAGFLPIGLAYHGGYCLAAALLLWGLTRSAWPSHLEDREAR